MGARRKVVIRYRGGSKPEASERTVHPYVLVVASGAWYALAHRDSFVRNAVILAAHGARGQAMQITIGTAKNAAAWCLLALATTMPRTIRKELMLIMHGQRADNDALRRVVLVAHHDADLFESTLLDNVRAGADGGAGPARGMASVPGTGPVHGTASAPGTGPAHDTPARPIRVLLAEDQSMVREALAALLGLEPDIEVVAQAARGDEVLDAARAGDVDVALLDIEMLGRTGIEAAAELREALPELKVVVLTTFGRPGYLRSAMEAGAVAFLVKDAPASQLADAVRRVLAGERVIDPTLAAAALAEGANPLTAREREILRAAADGATNAELAAALHLSQGTVRNYLSTAIQKLAARNRAEAVGIAREKGWL